MERHSMGAQTLPSSIHLAGQRQAEGSGCCFCPTGVECSPLGLATLCDGLTSFQQAGDQEHSDLDPGLFFFFCNTGWI